MGKWVEVGLVELAKRSSDTHRALFATGFSGVFKFFSGITMIF